MAEKIVRAEKVVGKALAVVYDGGDLGRELTELLRREGLRVIQISGEATLSVLEKPSYIVFFASPEDNERLRTDWNEAVVTAKRNQARLILCLDNLPIGATTRLVSEAQDLDYPASLAEIVGVFGNKSEVTGAAGKIVRELFSSQTLGKIMLVGKKTTTEGSFTSNTTNRQPKEREWKKHPFSKIGFWEKAARMASILIILFFLPLLISTTIAGWGVWDISAGKNLLVEGKFDQAAAKFDLGGERLALSAEVVGKWGLVAKSVGFGGVSQAYGSLLLLGKAAAIGAGHGVLAAKAGNKMIGEIIQSGGDQTDLAGDIANFKSELGLVGDQLGLIQAQWPTASGQASRLAAWGGIPPGKLTNLTDKIAQGREFLSSTQQFLDVLPAVLGKGNQTKKKYLVVFQNSSELRPTGGFIGSYAIVSFADGRLLDFKINDIYSADGQLRGRIQPPDELLHYLGQPSWFMRDANWAVDWELSAKRLEWFLEKETGERVDGVFGISLPAVQKFLAATGPLDLPELSETVTAADFYRKAEYNSEINFFPGSTQKRDFLGATAQAIISKMTIAHGIDPTAAVIALAQSLSAKDILLFFDSDIIQRTVEATSWAGEIGNDGCTAVRANCLMVVDANLGANKANFFLNRSIAVNTIIGKGGEVENRVTVRYQNNSPSSAWPGGTYKNYLRFLVPIDSQLVGFDLGNGRRAKVSTVLTADVIAAVPEDQFLVFQNFETSGKSRGANDNALLTFGTYFEVPVGQERTISFSYRPGYRVNFLDKEPKLDFLLLRQPGTGNDPVEVLVDYPEFLQAQPFENTLVFTQKLDYTNDLSVDRKISVTFKQQN